MITAKNETTNAKYGEILNKISAEVTKVENEPLSKSKIDLAYGYGQLKLSKETSKHCVFALTGGNMNGYYRFKKEFHGLSDIPKIFPEKTDRTLKYQTPCD